MKVPISWLREHCDPGLGVEELAEGIALRTTEVERISYVGPPSGEGFVVGKVQSVEAHPDADRLSVCEVETGDGTRTIVCGAPNVAAGQTVPVALPGARLPDGRELERAELRGVTSDGMILSEAELEVGDDAGGIVVINPAASSASRPGAAGSLPAPGTPLADVLPIAEPVLELEVNSNRVDCLGVYGVAREVHAFTGAELAAPPWEGDAEATGEGEASDYASVAVEVPELCPRFTARVFTDVEIGPSPLWLKARLTAAGQRPINNVVDITNYVMLLTAQPLHAFDLDKVPDGALIIRTAAEGETMTTLDGVERTFDSETVLVCDRDGPSGIAGIMGGAASEVSDSTTRVLLEVATWNGVNILRTSRKLGLRSEASNRFEKQLHPELAMRAQRIASKLMVEVCGARLVPGTIDAAAEIPPPHRVRMRTARADSLLGMSIEPELSVTYLERLGFGVEREDGELTAEVPGPSPLRRHPRGGPDRGGRSHPRLRRAPPGDAARGDRPGRPPDPRAGAAPSRRGRDARPRLRRPRQPHPHRPRAPGAAAAPRRRAPRRPDHRVEPALDRALGPAHDRARLASRRRPLQPRPRGRARRAVRVGTRLPRRGPLARRAASWEASSAATAARRRSSRIGSRRLLSARSLRRAGRAESGRATSSR